MEDSPIITPPVASPIVPVPHPSFFNRFSPKKKTSFLLLFVILGILVLGGGVLVYNNENNRQDKNEGNKQEQIGQYISDNVIVYGYWVEDSAVIAIHNLQNNTSGILTTLPINVKHVKITSPTTLLYIAETDARDHGKTITERNLETGEDTVVFSADEDFGIDDYAVSPNAKYLSIWEVKMPESSEVLIDGTSRVINLDRATNQQYVIYDEVFTASNPVHYPIGITDTGDLFTDRFLANSGAGWAYGMSRSNLTGSQKSNIPGMVNGTYSSQPTISPDGRYIAFAGYSGTDGTVEVNGFRKALANPDQVKLLSVATGAIETVQPQREKEQYLNVWWDKSSEALLFTKFLQEGDNFVTKDYKFNPNTKLLTSLPNPLNSNELLYSTLSSKLSLFIVYNMSSSFVGNLGGKYDQAAQRMFVQENASNTQSAILIEHKFIQIIAIKSNKYFPEDDIQVIQVGSKDQLQLQSFELKPELAPKRESQQSERKDEDRKKELYNPCGDLAIQRCNEKLGTNFPPPVDRNGHTFYGPDDVTPEFKKCFDELYPSTLPEGMNGVCLDSPLYLYGEEGRRLKVQVGVPLYSPNIPYSPQRGIETEISTNGLFYANGKLIEGFSFDYTPGIKKIQRPEYGTVVNRSDLEKTLTDYALKLGLNTKETTGLLKEVKTITSTYQFVSFFDHNTSHNILPLYFNPRPETYRNIVFYIEEFSQKPHLKPKSPTFDRIVREGLTAVEVSVFTR